MNILVTGGAGFIGSHFIRSWLAQSPYDQIRVLDKLTYAGDQGNLADIKVGIQFIHGDVCDRPLVRRLMSGIDTVVNFAAETHVDRSLAGGEA